MNNKLFYLAPVVSLVGIAIPNHEAMAQQMQPKNPNSGNLQFGFRGTINPFTKNGTSWVSYGAQLRVKVARRFNTEWFADYYPSIMKGKTERKDIRAGAVALYYPLHEIYTGKECTPYFSFGTTATYTTITARKFDANEQQVSRWSFGILAGMGMLLHVTPKMDIGFVTQYIGQLGSRFKFNSTSTISPERFPVQLPTTKVNFEGQLLFCMSMNYTIGDLW